ncbi:MAG: folate family ECF transporter S component [Clostridia bacterium]|nr:folate family ECF transporter S component [Clostridia bacterium]
MLKQKNNFSLLKKDYWSAAAANFKDTKMLVMAAVIIALRVVVKGLKVPVFEGISITWDCYVNSIGSMVYGPLVGLAVGAISDTIGCILFPTGPYFFPYIFVEMASAFIFGLFFWKKQITVPNAILSKFTVNLVCNLILGSVFYKWYLFFFYSLEKAEAYALINLTRIGKNLILFPLEAILIAVLLRAISPALASLGLINKNTIQKITLKHILLTLLLTIISVGLVLFYIFFLKDFISAHNIKLF